MTDHFKELKVSDYPAEISGVINELIKQVEALKVVCNDQENMIEHNSLVLADFLFRIRKLEGK